jgi:hypothetical protein
MELVMITPQDQAIVVNPETIERIVARARRERDAELGRLMTLGVAALRRMLRQAANSLRGGFGGTARHA